MTCAELSLGSRRKHIQCAGVSATQLRTRASCHVCHRTLRGCPELPEATTASIYSAGLQARCWQSSAGLLAGHRFTFSCCHANRFGAACMYIRSARDVSSCQITYDCIHALAQHNSVGSVLQQQWQQQCVVRDAAGN